jgi:hypothetical protein
VSEVILAPKEIRYTGITKPEIMLLLFKEGLTEVRIWLTSMTEKDTVIINGDILPIQTKAKTIVLDFKRTGSWINKKEYWAIIALAKLLYETQIYPLDAFKEAVSARSEFAEDNLAAITVGETLSLDIS